MTILVAVRGLTGAYLTHAESIGWAWLGETNMNPYADGDGDGDGDEEKKNVVVVVSVWGDQVIAAVVMRVVKSDRKAWIRAWTTKLKYRGHGVGKGVLEEAVRLAVEEFGCLTVEFDDGHASEFLIFLFDILWFLYAWFHHYYYSLSNENPLILY